MFLSSGRKPEYPERTHAYTGTCKLHTERPQLGFEPGTLVWKHHTTMQPAVITMEKKLLLCCNSCQF